MRKVFLIILSTLVLLMRCYPKDNLMPGSIRGEVVTRTQDGEPAVLPHASIVLRGPTIKATESDAQGAFVVDGLPPGIYDIEASAPGLSSAITVEVKPSATLQLPIELTIATVMDMVTVKGSEPAPIEESSSRATISQSTVEAAPNQNERIDSLLPLVPGVVRGPDGRINMKGAQATQVGWMVNSTNVTDPATGGQAIKLPIDVVLSAQVISNPYDPEYGKFTGAVSSIETRSSNFNKFTGSGFGGITCIPWADHSLEVADFECPINSLLSAVAVLGTSLVCAED